MPLDEFWHGDLRLLEVYQKAYYRDRTYTAWINGARIFEANSAVSINANRTKKSDKIEKYSDWKDPFERKRIISQENAENEFRQEQLKQNSWLHDMLSK